jgi:hypothetical protein
MAPANRKNLNPTVSRPVASVVVQCSQIDRVGIDSLECFTQNIDVMNKINALHPKAQLDRTPRATIGITEP